MSKTQPGKTKPNGKTEPIPIRPSSPSGPEVKVLSLVPEDIILDWAANGRYKPDETEIDSMLESIRKVGQMTPIMVTPTPGSGSTKRYRVVFGYRRLAAIRKFNHLHLSPTPMRVSATVFHGNQEEIFLRNIEENRERKSISSMDVAYQIRRWMDLFHKSKIEISNIYSKSARWVDVHLRVLVLEEKIRDKIHRGELSIWSAVELADLDDESRTEVLREIDAGGEKPSRSVFIKKSRKMGRLIRPRCRSRKEVVGDYLYLAESDKINPSMKKLLKFLAGYQEGVGTREELESILVNQLIRVE